MQGNADGKSINTAWHDGSVTRPDRERLLGQRGATMWLTGLSGSGKSTVAVAVESRLIGSGRLCYRVDGDNLRHGLNRNLGFSVADRAENVRRTGEVCRILADTGVIVLASLVSPFRADRAMVRALHDDWKLPFIEVFIDVPLEVAESRDPKGLYKKARAGEIRDFTGIHQPYEAPERAEMVLDSMSANGLEVDDFISVIFTATSDLVSEFPAYAARRLGFGEVPLLCARELEIAGSMPRVVRMMAHVETDLPKADITHVYLHGAAALRSDLTRVRSVPDDE